MDIIVRGESQELDFVRRLCRDKVRRGLLAILPATSPACDDVVRLKNERDETVIQLREKDARISELEERLSLLTVPNATEPAENAADNSENPDAVDDKNVEVEDMLEADLDADDKTPVINDTKDVPATDSKETETTKKDHTAF
jgi:hypothetical protein